jgi:hydroxyethylthiazole kinase-like uncharacterized protein yjeF
MPHEILTPLQMGEIDRAAIVAGPFDGYALMRNAGAAVAREVLRRYPAAAHVDVLCGPGNNGGDGYVVARLLAEAGIEVGLWATGAPKPGSDAALAAADCPLPADPLADYRPTSGSVLVDALFGAGLARPLDERFAGVFDRIRDARIPVVAVDLPSGVSGLTGQAEGPCVDAELTVTFVRQKPGHLLYPGRTCCGEVIVADIGIPDRLVGDSGLSENLPAKWLGALPMPSVDAHKYSRGHVAVFSGGPTSTGAARLSAMAATRSGAGAVTVLSPASALQVNAAHLTSIMLRRVDEVGDALSFINERKVGPLCWGQAMATPKVCVRPPWRSLKAWPRRSRWCWTPMPSRPLPMRRICCSSRLARRRCNSC